MKEKNNIEQFDQVFKQQLENASMQPPAGLFESMSSSVGTSAVVAKTTIFAKLIISVIAIASVATITYFALSDTKENNNQSIITEKVILNSNTIENKIENDNIEELASKTTSKDKIETQIKDRKLAFNSSTLPPKEIKNTINSSPEIFKFEVPILEEPTSTPVIKEAKIENKIIQNNNDVKVAEQPEPAYTNIIDSSYIFIPNAVTPNGDGLNDEYLIDIKGEERVQIIIFDKNNKRLFETKNKQIAWKCTLANGELAPDGDYVVKVIYTFKNKEQQTKTIKLKLIK